MDALATMPKYEAYKESGVEWLGVIPSEWDLIANKHIFKLKKRLVGKRSSLYELLSLTLRGIIKRDMENPEGKFPAEFDTYQEVASGDFVFCLFDVEETPRTVGLSPFDGMITGAYTVFECLPEFEKRFLYYFYLNLDSSKRMKPLYKGLRNTIPKDAFLSFKTFVPKKSIQTAIANFLDQKTAQIDDAIAIKEKQIALLKERKQIIIQKAVTQGLNPDVQMKDSGVDWIGQIPEHWDIFRLKQGCRKITDGAHISPDLSSELHPFISTVNVDDYGNIDFERCIYTSQSCYDYLKRTGCSPIKGDVLFSKDGTVGRTAVVDGNRDFVIASSLVIIRPNKKLFSSNYLDLVLSSGLIKKQTDSVLSGSALRRISIIKVSNLLLFKVPIEEQLDIVRFCEGVATSIKEAIELQLRQIEKLKEYKATLINSAVTGKIKVA